MVDAHLLAGEKIDPKTDKVTPVTPGPCSFFLSTHLVRLFNEHAPGPGDVIRVRLAEIRASENNLKLYGFEFLERVSASPPPHSNGGAAVNPGDDVIF